MIAIELRPGTRQDSAFLRAMLYEAAYWRPGGERPPLDEGLAYPDLAKIIEAWGERVGDTAVIAFQEDGEHVGAAWYRFWRRDDHSYGFVDERIPEIGIGVLEAYRGRGFGSALLAALVGQARQDRIPALSLSVERDNEARRLYERIGFRPLGAGGNSLTMVLGLCLDGQARSPRSRTVASAYCAR
jgi:GNAT superfamily N-acetyltransferase